jgi:hypothetical protein
MKGRNKLNLEARNKKKQKQWSTKRVKGNMDRYIKDAKIEEMNENKKGKKENLKGRKEERKAGRKQTYKETNKTVFDSSQTLY